MADAGSRVGVRKLKLEPQRPPTHDHVTADLEEKLENLASGLASERIMRKRALQPLFRIRGCLGIPHSGRARRPAAALGEGCWGRLKPPIHAELQRHGMQNCTLAGGDRQLGVATPGRGKLLGDLSVGVQHAPEASEYDTDRLYPLGSPSSQHIQ